MRSKLLATISIGLLSAACQAPYGPNGGTTTAAYYGNNPQVSTQACADYGFRSGTLSFDQCVSREQAARSAGRVNRDYSPALLNADARSACSSYGLDVGAPDYNRCVTREIDARAYRGAAMPSSAAFHTDQNGYRIDSRNYRVDARGYPAASQTPYYPPVTQTYSNEPVFRDELGNRYDAQGNRIDSRGRVIAMPESHY